MLWRCLRVFAVRATAFVVEGHLLTRLSTNVNLCGRHIERFGLRQYGLFKMKKTDTYGFDISQKSVPRPHPTKEFRHGNGEPECAVPDFTHQPFPQP